MQETEAYITIKDHKDEFPNKILFNKPFNKLIQIKHS